MFVENYRLDTMMGGQAQSMIPYPKISDDDWVKWKAFLPVKAEVICKTELLGKPKAFLHTAYGIPTDVCQEMTKGPDISIRSKSGPNEGLAKILLRWDLLEMA